MLQHIVRTPYFGKFPSDVTTVKSFARADAIMKRSVGSLCNHGNSAALSMSSEDIFNTSISYNRTTESNHYLAAQGKTILPLDTFMAISHAVTGETKTTGASEMAARPAFERLRSPDASHSKAHVSSSKASVIHRLPV